MKLRFDPRQPYQLDAVQAVVDVFAGQPVAPSAFEVRTGQGSPLAGGGDAGLGNALGLTDRQLLENVRAVQRRHGLPLAEALRGRHFSVEMETGTGKTYVYLRTMYELHRAYGWTRFVLVVPSVAIREGALQSVELLREHFAGLYGRVPLDVRAFRAEEAGRLREYAQATTLQLLVLNIDAFNKKAVNVIYDVRDRTGPYAPIEYLRATRPVVILDEPQNMESRTAREAIAALDPLCTLRYSATHRDAYNLLYRLTPVDAYDLGLVKRIEVDSVLETGDFNRPYVRVRRITASKTTVSAKLEIDAQTPAGPERRTVIVKGAGADLFDLSNGRERYRGYVVGEISAAGGFVAFTNGVTVEQGHTHGGRSDELMRVQIRETIRSHFEKERRLAGRPPEQRIKVLSLFFIDRVAHYAAEDGKIRRWFEEEYEALRTHYADLDHPPAEQVHGGYFATTRKGEAKDTSGTTRADEDAYELIMRDKERLLSTDEPLRFIFSHSALREGWDNPNVFQICTLNETRSELKKRQEIGRGLRLPVMASGERCRDEQVNRLTVIANEAYDDFARQLQQEIEQDTGVAFGGRIRNARERRRAHLAEGWRRNDDFRALWDRIRHRTRYRVRFSTDDLVTQAAAALAASPPVAPPQLVIQRADVEVSGGRLAARATSASHTAVAAELYPIPDLLGYLQRETELTRPTLAAILARSGRLADAAVNPQAFLDHAAGAIGRVLHRQLAEGVAYERLDGEAYDLCGFEEHEPEGYLASMVEVGEGRSISGAVFVDSEAERTFAEALNARADVRFFLKLPGWFTIPTPDGPITPGWAIRLDGGTCLVVDLDGAGNGVHSANAARARCSAAHFDALRRAGHDVGYRVVRDAGEIAVAG